MLFPQHARIIHARAGFGVERIAGFGGVKEFGANGLQRIRREIGDIGEAIGEVGGGMFRRRPALVFETHFLRA